VSAQVELELGIALHRSELKAYCSRMLGSPVDADDAVQETLLRAWRSADGFEGRAAVRTWLYRIATNVCIDTVRRRTRQPIPIEDGLEPSQEESEHDPAELALAREDLRLALTATVHRLPSRQRAVLLLREALGWRAAEVAELLEMSVQAVNSALQRARATLAASDPACAIDDRGDAVDRLVGRYLTSFELDDVEGLTALSRG
jgi:RNA polymerase sigma-70 factor (ECF subfamily)